MKQLENLNENDLVFYDIETSRAVKELDSSTQLYDAWKYKARYQNELNKKTGKEYTVEEYFYEKAPLYAPFGRVVTVVVGRIRNNRIVLKSYASYDEKELLENFNRDLQAVYEANPKTRFVSFNGVGFDTPYLEKRSIINGVKPSNLLEESHLEPWKVTQLDLSKIWKGNAFYPDSLLAVATALGLPSPKDALDGSQVSEAFYDGRLDEIERYCLKDVETTARVYRKLAFLPDLEVGFDLLNTPIEVRKVPLLEKLFNTKQFNQEVKDYLKKAKILKKDKATVEKLVLASYLEIIDVMEKNKKELNQINEDRTTEVKEFFKTL